MSRKRPGWRSQERTYRYLTADLQHKAIAEQVRNKLGDIDRKLGRMHAAAVLALHELRQRHRDEKCHGGCPCAQSIAALEAEFGLLDELSFAQIENATAVLQLP